jgi:LuxR family maltose regulon positive regulatory protein
VLLAQGDGAAAEEAIRRGIEVGRGAGRLFTAYGLMALAEALRAGGDQDAAREAIAAARETVAACPDPGRLGELVERSARGLGATAPAAVAAGTDLSERELEVLRLLPGTLSQREIAAELYVSINTVKTHTRSIFRKLDASNRDEAVARAHERGLL